MAKTFLCGGLLLDAVTTLISLPSALELGGLLATSVAIAGGLWCFGSDIHLLSHVLGQTSLPDRLDVQQFVRSRS